MNILKYPLLLPLSLLFIALFLRAFALKNIPLPEGDATTYLVIARNFINTGYPLHSSSIPHDVINNNGVYLLNNSQNIGQSLWFSLWMRFFGQSDLVVFYSSIVTWISSLFLLYRLSDFVYNNKVAVVSTLFFITSPSVQQYIMSGLAEELLILLFLMLAIIIFSFNGYKRDVGIGIVLGMVYWVKSATAIFVFPFVLLYLFLLDRKIQRLILLILVSLIIILPSSSTHLYDYSNPQTSKPEYLDLAFGFERAKWNQGIRSLKLPQEWEKISLTDINFIGGIINRYIVNIIELFGRSFYINFLFIIAPLSLLGIISEIKRCNLKYPAFFAGIYLSLLAGFAVGWPIERYLIPSLALMVIPAANYICSTRSWLLITAAIVTVNLVFSANFYRKSIIECSDGARAYIDEIIQNTKSDDYIIANSPVQLAWYTGINTVLYPDKLDDLNEIGKIAGHKFSIVLTSSIRKIYRSSSSHQMNWDASYSTIANHIGSNYCLSKSIGDGYALIYRRCK